MPLKIVFCPLLDHGHCVISIAIAKALFYKKPDSEIYFVTDQEYADFVKGKCSVFRTLVYENEDRSQNKHQALVSYLNKYLCNGPEVMKAGWSGAKACARIEKWRAKQDVIRKMVEQVDPDLVFIDALFNLPFLMKFRWVQIDACNMLHLGNYVDNPPCGGGKIENFEEYAEDFRNYTSEFRARMDEWYKEFGLVRKPVNSFLQGGPYFNIFTYPKKLSYFDVEQQNVGKWIQLHSAVLPRKVEQFFEENGWGIEPGCAGKEILTEEFLRKPGRLVLVTLGTIMSWSVEIFRDRILPAIAASPHKFVVAKGGNGDQFDLPANCVGANKLKQLEFLDGVVDLFISHGGNNSFCESIYYGVPMVIIAGFGDHLDNACRLETFNLGKRLDLVDLTEQRLQTAIEFVLNDETIKKNMKELSKSAQADDDMEQLVDLIIQHQRH